MQIAMQGNYYMQTVKPWETAKTDMALAGAQLSVIYNVLYLLAIVFEPFMPSFSRKLLTQLNLPMPKAPLKGIDVTNKDAIVWNLTKAFTPECTYPQFFPLSIDAKHTLGETAILFTKIDPKKIDELRQKYTRSR
eukprot:UN07507